jgi:hypothetical protein
LEGALQRALEPPPTRPVVREATRPHFDAPAPHIRADATKTPQPVLNPFAVYRQGEYVLVRELGALNTARLRDVAVGFGLLDASAASGMSRESLTAVILAAVRPASTEHKGNNFVI